jgi:mRNA-degrading endonuclease toxin of MazEF toxin-antitoxin module
METPIHLRGRLCLVKPDVALRLGVPKNRPWLIVQNDDLASYPHRIACYTTGMLDKNKKFKFTQMLSLDTHVPVIADGENKLDKDSFIACGNIYTIRNDEFLRTTGKVSADVMGRVDVALAKALALKNK